MKKYSTDMSKVKVEEFKQDVRVTERKHTMAQTYMKGPIDPASQGPVTEERLAEARKEL